MNGEGTIRSTIRASTQYRPFSKVAVIAVCLVGLLFYSYPPLVIRLGETRVFRPDWLLSLPVLVYVMVIHRRLNVTQSGLAALVFLAVATASAFLAGLPAPFDFLTVFVQLAYAIALFVALISMRISFEEFRFLLRFWIVLLLAVGAYGIYQAIALNVGLPFGDPYFGQFSASFETMGYARPASVFAEPSFYASALLTGIAILVPCVAAAKPILFSERTEDLALLTLVVALVTSGSISGFVTGGLSTIFFLVVPDTRGFVLRIISVAGPLILLVVAVGIFLGVSLVTVLVERFSRGYQVLVGPIPAGGSSIHVRYGRLLAGIEAWRQFPVFGTGLGQYATWASEQHFASIRRWLLPATKPLDRIHGAWIQVLAMSGSLGFFAFSTTWIAVVRSELASIVGTSGPGRVLCVAALSLTIVQLIDWGFGFGFIHPYRWVLIAIATSYVTGQIQ